jgi:low affinity Fe/Cu permease
MAARSTAKKRTNATRSRQRLRSVGTPLAHQPTGGVDEMFRRFANGASRAAGSAWAFILAVAIVIGWAALGPVFGYSDTWQLVINTGTTIITFLMVFLIQNTQNRDAIGLHLKLDELIKATGGARNTMIDLDALSDADLKSLEEHYKTLCKGSVDDPECDA